MDDVIEFKDDLRSMSQIIINIDGFSQLRYKLKIYNKKYLLTFYCYYEVVYHLIWHV